MEQFQTPVLYLIFNRPGVTRTTFQRIRELKPALLFIAADGPRKSHPDDVEKCKTAREAVFSLIDWECEVQTLLRDENLGCGLAVSQAITWFFEHVEEGIILEDDCLPDPSFFWFCEELLGRYRYFDQVMMISGYNRLGSFRNKYSYITTQSPGGIWGWATWRRAWGLYDYKLSNYDSYKWDNLHHLSFGQIENFKTTLHEAINSEYNSWDYQWLFCILYNNGFSIRSRKNIVRNLGFNEMGTHTKNVEQKIYEPRCYRAKFPLKHPPEVSHNMDFMNMSYEASMKQRRGIYSRIRMLRFRIAQLLSTGTSSNL